MKKLTLFVLFFAGFFLGSANGVRISSWDYIAETVDVLSGKATRRYDCTSKPASEWYSTGQIRIGWAVYYLTSGVLFQVLGWPVIYVFLTKFKSPPSALRVYRLMALIGVFECLEVWGVSIWPGWAALNGEVFCSSPRMSWLVGKGTMVLWLSGTLSVIFLGLHRLSDLTNKCVVLLNTTKKTISWIVLFTIYGLYGSLFYDTVLFNSVFMAPLLDPKIGTPDVEYRNEFLQYHNCGASLLLVTVYATMVFAWKKQQPNASSIMMYKIQKSVLIQSLCTSATYTIPALAFVLIFHLRAPPAWLVMCSDLAYQLSGGLPFIMYIFVNKALRVELGRLLGVSKNTTTTLVTTMTKTF